MKRKLQMNSQIHQLFLLLVIVFLTNVSGAESELPGPRMDGPFDVTPMHLPEDFFSVVVAVAAKTERVAAASGDEAQTLLVNTPNDPNTFEPIWTPYWKMSKIRSIAWSPDGRKLAMLIAHVNPEKEVYRTDLSVYVYDTASKEGRKLLTIAKSDENGEKRYYRIPKNADFAWLDNKTICTHEMRNQIVTIDAHYGTVDTKFETKTARILSLRNAQGAKVRFVTEETDPNASEQLSVIEYDGKKLKSICKVSKLSKNQVTELRGAGEYLFYIVDGYDPQKARTLIYRIGQNEPVAEIPVLTTIGDKRYMYHPIEIFDNQLYMIEKTTLGGRPPVTIRLVKMKLKK